MAHFTSIPVMYNLQFRYLATSYGSVSNPINSHAALVTVGDGRFTLLVSFYSRAAAAAFAYFTRRHQPSRLFGSNIRPTEQKTGCGMGSALVPCR